MKLPGPAVRAVLFDLDGTLVDSAADLHGAMNTLLERRGFAALSLDQVISMIGHGIRTLVERAFKFHDTPLAGHELDRAAAEMTDIYSTRLTQSTTLLPGAAEAVAALASMGVAQGVVTNKPRAATDEILAHFGLLAQMGAVVGGDSGLPRKPAPDMILSALDTLGIEPAEAVMVGDSPADIDSARAAGVRAIAVRGGYTPVSADEFGADAVIDTLADLVPLLPLGD